MKKSLKLGFFYALGLTGCSESLFSESVNGVENSDGDRYEEYYQPVVGHEESPETLRKILHEIIAEHTRYPYTSDTQVDTWDILEEAQRVSSSEDEIRDIYRDDLYPLSGERDYNREHSWPKSYGFPDLEVENVPYTDCHALFLADAGYNSSRNNRPYQDCDETCRDKPTARGDANRVGARAWETWSGRRGDVARAIFYMDLRYEGDVHEDGAFEPDLVVTNDLSAIANSSTGDNETVGYMGMRSVLLEWHQEDPVDNWERQHNDVVAAYQQNRNPFVDHPEWVECIYLGFC